MSIRSPGTTLLSDERLDEYFRSRAPIAARDLSGGRVVILTASGVDYPLLSVLEEGDAILGITKGATMAGQPVSYQFEGRMTDPAWTWVPGPIFCGGVGVLLQSVPVGQWLRQVGEAVSATEIMINLFPTYYRES